MHAARERAGIWERSHIYIIHPTLFVYGDPFHFIYFLTTHDEQVCRFVSPHTHYTHTDDKLLHLGDEGEYTPKGYHFIWLEGVCK